MSATPARAAERRIVVIQGEYQISAGPEVVLSTLLGSCVAMCLYDPIARAGGMNHFLLPGLETDDDGTSSLRYGAHAMELLVNGLVAAGARRHQLRAKLFGGARMLAGLTDLGSRNAEFAEDYLRRENIAYTGGSLRGDRGRRIEFWPHTGRTRQLLVGTEFAPEPYAPPASHAGSVELF